MKGLGLNVVEAMLVWITYILIPISLPDLSIPPVFDASTRLVVKGTCPMERLGR